MNTVKKAAIIVCSIAMLAGCAKEDDGILSSMDKAVDVPPAVDVTGNASADGDVNASSGGEEEVKDTFKGSPAEELKHIHTKSYDKFASEYKELAFVGQTYAKGSYNCKISKDLSPDLGLTQDIDSTLNFETQYVSLPSSSPYYAYRVGLDLNQKDIADVDAVMTTSDIYLRSVANGNGQWVKIGFDDVNESSGSSGDLTETIEKFSGNPEIFTDFADAMLNDYMTVITDDNVTRTEEDLTLGLISQSCVKYEVTVSDVQMDQLIDAWKKSMETTEYGKLIMQMQEDAEKNSYIARSEAARADMEGASAEIKEEPEADIRNVAVVYYAADNNIIGMELDFDVSATNNDIYDHVTLQSHKVKDDNKFEADMGFEIRSSDPGNSGSCGVTVNGTVSDLDRLSGEIHIMLDVPLGDITDGAAEDFKDIKIDFDNYSYILGKNGYMTGNFTLSASEFSHLIDEAYESSLRNYEDIFNMYVNDMEMSEEDAKARLDEYGYKTPDKAQYDAYKNYALKLSFDKGKGSLALSNGSSDLVSMTAEVSCPENSSLDITVPADYTEYSEDLDMNEFVDMNAISRSVQEALGMETPDYSIDYCGTPE